MPIYKMEGKKQAKQKYRVFVNYTDNQGKYHKKSKIVYGLDEAKECERNLAREISQTIPDSKMTVQQLYDEYKATKSTEVRESTMRELETTLTLHILPYLKSVKIDKLNAKVLQNWKNEIAAKDYKIKTKQNIYKHFRALLNYAVKMEYLTRNPLLIIGNFKEPYFEVQHDKLQYYTSKQFKKYIKQAKPKSDTSSEWGYYVFFNIAFYTGMRKGEINALKWSDVDENIIHVRRSVTQKIKGKDIVETPPKNKSSYRDLYIPSALVEILNQYKSIQKRDKRFTEDFRVCGGASCLSDSSIEIHNKRYSEAAGLPHIRIHDFRHSHASLLVNNGILIQEVARRLGHSKVDVTWNTYSHLYPKQETEALKVLESV